jgi:2,4-dienoyl-CoA reductase-like NADH-dependent reductase (Old Yellow Enzyme family)
MPKSADLKAAQSQAAPLLLQPAQMRELILRNRIMVSSMAMYSSQEGFADDFHLVHLGRFALGGAGLVMTEATAVSEHGRITAGCNGLWRDEHIEGLRRVTDFLHRFGAAAGLQLGHSGWKGATQRPWHGGAPLTADDERGEEPWPVVSPSPEPFASGWAIPHELSKAELDEIVEDFRQATRRGQEAGFDLLEVHCAHGYLLHSFLSPLANRRSDAYGGSLENRMRFPLRAVEAVRDLWPDEKPLFVRISTVDGIDVGWSIADSIAFARALRKLGVDAIDCSSGGMRVPREQQVVSRTPGFHLPYSERIRAEADIPTVAVGLIRDPRHAEAILRDGQADFIAIARELLFNPNWAAQAALELQPDSGWNLWPEQFRWWLERRARLFKPRPS